jgi:predicted transcriptional regulator of viral defense system
MGIDEAVMKLAARQHGVVTLAQLRAAGMSREAVRHRVESGRLTRLHRGVYLAASLPAQLTRETAAVLACGTGSVLSHHSAAALWGIRPPHRGAVHVTISGRKARSRDGITVHRAGAIEWTRRHGVPIAMPARTLRDLAR